MFVHVDTYTDMWYFITQHPKLTPLGRDAIIEVIPGAVDPETDEYDHDDPSKNTKTYIMLELGVRDMVSKYYNGEEKEEATVHYWEMDVSADTLEQAVPLMYNKVLLEYGDYTVEEQEQHWLDKHNVNLPK